MRSVMRFICGVALIIGPALLSACSDAKEADEPAYQPDAIEMLSTDITAPSEGGALRIEFSCTGDWSLQTSDDVRFNNGLFAKTSGSNNETTLHFTALPNTSAQDKFTKFTLHCGRASVEVEIRHPAMECELTDEATIKEMLLKLYAAVDGEHSRFRGNWKAELPLSQWGNTVKYSGGELELYLNETNIKGEVDLAGCTALKTLRVSKNQLTKLNLKGCTRLETVDATSNQIKDIDIDGCLSLRRLTCGYNAPLSRIDVANYYCLEQLYISDCSLPEIDLAGCISLRTINVANNNLTKLAVPERAKLEDLFCFSNKIEKLDVSGSPWLYLLNCGDNVLTDLDISGCTRLKRLYCYENLLSTLDLTDQREILFEVYCFTNRLTALDIAGYRTLSTLHCSDNDLRQLDVSGCKSLTSLYASYNYLETLTASDDMSLVTLDLTRNRMKQIPLELCHYGAKVYCAGNTDVNSEIPEHADSFVEFEHDARYEYGLGGMFTDRGYGWWYPGEPQSGAHKRQ